ncbi:hypothetical protein [Cytobacillus dafuensis]|uniref:Uncharacterized protein n=1 Tax=Cytobacillus dafuensis TaxID=1742359 RepID=A0A5B8Z4P8_CYTDA|nr:hypothetical protein [Cytobacillus dafuensis]QED48092.1 hypothetical protein FSZ17_13055 [Cytobacillus dafuensis]
MKNKDKDMEKKKHHDEEGPLLISLNQLQSSAVSYDGSNAATDNNDSAIAQDNSNASDDPINSAIAQDDSNASRDPIASDIDQEVETKKKK